MTINDRIERLRAALAKGEKLNGEPITADLVAFEKSLDNTFTDHYAMQGIQSRLFASGKIGLAVAQTIYVALGEAPAEDGWAAGTDLATKVVVTEYLGAMLRGQIASVTA
jgi:hypothetical protein